MLSDRIKTDPRMAELVKRYPQMLKCTNIIHCGGDAKSHYEAEVRQLKIWVEFVGRDDPWMDPGMLPPQRVLYDMHLSIIQAERELFESAMDIGGPDALQCHHAGSPSVYVNYRVQAMWATWLAARLGFTGVFK